MNDLFTAVEREEAGTETGGTGERGMNDLFTMIRESSLTEWEKGVRFEQLMKRGLERHPGEYGPKRFKQIWAWQEWPERVDRGFDSNDIGIDLVGRQTEAHGGGLCAIQCKFYEKKTVPTKQIDSFLAAATPKVFRASFLIVTTGVTRHAKLKIDNASPQCEVQYSSDLARWPFDWAEFIDRPDDLTHHHKLYTPHSYQKKAVRKLCEGLSERGTRGKLILPCGTGKSVVALWAAERIAGVGGKVLYLVPSISLMGQTMREWARQSSMLHRYLGVCSDQTSGRVSRGHRDLSQLAMRVSTDQQKITEAMLALDSDVAAKHMNVVFSTYQSLPRIAEAQDSGAPEFDLIICDEAHRTTGIESSKAAGSRKAGGSGFRLVHDNGRVRGHRRLFMTATPRVFTERAKSRAKARQADSFSMDDPELYGRVLYSMSFADAIDGDWLSDYKVVVISASEEKWRATYEGNTAAMHAKTGISFRDYVKLVGCWDALADPHTTRAGGGRVTGQVATADGGGGVATAARLSRSPTGSKAPNRWPNGGLKSSAMSSSTRVPTQASG